VLQTPLLRQNCHLWVPQQRQLVPLFQAHWQPPSQELVAHVQLDVQ
jgi:hypothetical protein